ncbi:hypothetical protein GBA52_003793 [Prunus armeniaca]|nr:hypothetical protein GBA52_003793 [Prunus armeniaca]
MIPRTPFLLPSLGSSPLTTGENNKITIKDAKQRMTEVFRSSSNRPREIEQLLSLCDDGKVVGEFIVTQLYNRVMRNVGAWQPGTYSNAQ